jgi:hypothetical protein
MAWVREIPGGDGKGCRLVGSCGARRVAAGVSKIGFLLLFGAVAAQAQAVAEYAGATSGVSAGVHGAKEIKLPSSSAGKKAVALHLPARPLEASPELKHRRELEEQAGEKAAKVLLRSVPSRAQVWIDGKLVGRTPLLLILAPRRYQVEMRGPRMAAAHREMDLLPEETQEVVFPLVERYPTEVRLR